MPSITIPSLSTVASVASIAGTGISALGALSTGQANAAAANYSAQVAANNATTASQNAAYATQAGEQAATTQSLKGRAEAQHLKGEIAANGIDVNSGSAVDLEAGQLEKQQLDTETVRQNAALTAYGYRTTATSDIAQSQLDKAQAGFAQQAGLIGAGGSLLSGAGNIGLKWAGLNPTTSTTANGNPFE